MSVRQPGGALDPAIIGARNARHRVDPRLDIGGDKVAQTAVDRVQPAHRVEHRAAAQSVDPEAFRENAAILARDEYIGVDKAILLRSISENLVLSNGKPPVHFPDFMFQYGEAANFPWMSHGGWLYTQMARWGQTQFSDANYEAACGVFRPDVYRSALRETGDVLPGANSKVEGSLDREVTPAPAEPAPAGAANHCSHE